MAKGHKLQVKLGESKLSRFKKFLRTDCVNIIKKLENVSLQFLQIIIMLVLHFFNNNVYQPNDYLKNCLIIYIVDVGAEIANETNRKDNSKVVFLLIAVVFYVVIELCLLTTNEIVARIICGMIIFWHFLKKYFLSN